MIKKTYLIGVFFLASIFSTSLFAQYMGGIYTDVFTIRGGGVLNNTAASYEGVEQFGNGLAGAAAIGYDRRMNPLTLHIGFSFLSHQPKITTEIKDQPDTERIVITNYATIDLLFKYVINTGAYIGIGGSFYAPVHSELKKPRGEGYANLELGWNVQISSTMFFSPAVRIGYNVTNNQTTGFGATSASEYNIQFYFGLGFRAFQEAGFMG